MCKNNNKRDRKTVDKCIVKKTRKTMQQKLALDQFYKELRGETPTKDTISDLAAQLNLTEQ
jgi:hypothetical protein